MTTPVGKILDAGANLGIDVLEKRAPLLDKADKYTGRQLSGLWKDGENSTGPRTSLER
jgi:hypothetical protein